MKLNSCQAVYNTFDYLGFTVKDISIVECEKGKYLLVHAYTKYRDSILNITVFDDNIIVNRIISKNMGGNNLVYIDCFHGIYDLEEMLSYELNDFYYFARRWYENGQKTQESNQTNPSEDNQGDIV